MLRFNNFDVVVLQLVDAADHDGELAGDLTLVDVETGESREMSMTPALKERFHKRTQERRREIARYCASRGVPHFVVDVDVPFDDVVLSVLRAGGLLR